jgi:hypothetical protein
MFNKTGDIKEKWKIKALISNYGRMHKSMFTM